MGCGGSREGADRQIDYNMEWIYSHDINQFFQSSQTVLETAEGLRAGFEDSLETMQDISHVNFLKTPGTLVDCVKVWIWTLSANNEGDINKCKPSVSKESPYLDVDLGKECPHCFNNTNRYCANCPMNQCAAFKEALQTYIKTCIEGVKNLPDTIKSLGDLLEKANELKNNASTSLSNLGALDKAKALATIGKNTLKLTKGISKLKAVAQIVEETVKNMQVVVKEFQDIVKTANDYGKKAIEKKITLPADIMYHLHPAEKFTEAQIKKMKEDAEKKRKAEDEAKKKKADLISKIMAAKAALAGKK